jgi:hypothetical protein
MPFKSQAQRAFMHAVHPQIAKEMESKTPKGKKLPKHVKAAGALRDAAKNRKRRPDGRFG